MLRNLFRRRRPEQLDVDVVDRSAAQEAAEQEAAQRRLLDQAARCHDGAEPDAPGWNTQTTVIPSVPEHRAGGAQ